MSDNQNSRNFTAYASINDYEYNANFTLGNFEDKNRNVRMIEGIEFCMKQTYKDNRLNEEKFKNCYSLRKQLLDNADKVNMFFY